MNLSSADKNSSRDVVARFREYLRSRSYSTPTVKNYLSDLRHLIIWISQNFQEFSFSHITEKNLQAYKSEIKERFRVKPAISARRLSSLRTFVSWAQEEGLLTSDLLKALFPILKDKDDSEAVSQFRNYLKTKRYSIPTIKNYLSDLRHLISWIEQNYEKFKFSLINEKSVRGYRSFLKEKFRATPSIAARRLSSLRNFLYWAQKNGLVTEDLLEAIEKVLEEPIFKPPVPVAAPPVPIQVVTPPYPVPTPPAIDLSRFKLHQRVIHHIKNTRPEWYQRYHQLNFADTLHFVILVVYILLVGSFIFYSYFLKPGLDQTRDDISNQLAQIGEVLAAVAPPSVLSFQGRLTDSSDVPIVVSTDIIFRVYDDETAGSLLWTSKTWGVTPDQNGIFSVCLGNQTTTDDCLINGVADTAFPATLFTDNAALYLAVQVEAETLSPRQRISSVSYALNSDALEGFHGSQSPGADQVPILDSSGNLIFAGAATVGTGAGALTLDSASGTLTLGAGTNTIVNADAATALLINPTGNLQFQSSSNFITSAGNMTLVGDLTLSETTPSITFTDTTAGDDDWLILVGADDLIIRNTVASSPGDLEIQDSSSNVLASIDELGKLELVQTNQTYTTRPDVITINSQITLDFASAAVGALQFSPTVIYEQAGGAFGAAFVFNNQATFKNVSGEANRINVIFGFLNQPILQADTQALTSANATTLAADFLASPTFNVVNGGSLEVTNWHQFRAAGTVDTGVTVTNRSGLHVFGATVSGTLTNQYGIYLAPMTTGTNDYGICFDCDGTFGTTGSGTGIVWGTDSTTTRNVRMFRNNTTGIANFVLEDGAGTDLINATTSVFQLNLSATTTYTEVLCHSGADAATGVVEIADCNVSGGGDIAEYFGSDGTLQPGDLVAVDPSKQVEGLELERVGYASKVFVTSSDTPYQNQVMGVISTNPFREILSSGVFDEETEHPVAVALTGRVPVKVSLENGPIQPGDPLTSSSTPGVAMKATKSGPIIGKALQSYDGPGVGEMVVFVSVGWYIAPLENNQRLESGLGSFNSLETGGLTAEEIKAESIKTNELTIGEYRFGLDAENNLTTNLALGKKFKFVDNLGHTVAWISYVGEAFFKKIQVLAAQVGKLIIKDEVVIAKEADISGTAQFEEGNYQVKIESDKVGGDSLIYLTPTTKTDGLVLYVKEKEEGKGFTVALDRSSELTQLLGQQKEATPSASKPIEFNWLIINQE